MNKIIIIFFAVIGFTIFTSFNPYPPGKRISVVVIDAGHGGTDPGCHGLKHNEKDIALAISLKVGKYIEENIRDVKVLYTRKTDTFVPLNEIAAHANKNNADLFICIHCNAAVNKEIYGTETYAMGLKKSKGNLDVAKRENASILFEDDYKNKYEGFDPHSDEANIIFSMYQNVFLDQSLSFAANVQEEMRKNKNLTDKGVKQAGFLVLWKTSMPSVLIETGFLTNPEEENYLASKKGQDEIAFGIYKAFKKYKADIEDIPVIDGIEKRDNIEEEPDTIKPKEVAKTEPIKEETKKDTIIPKTETKEEKKEAILPKKEKIISKDSLNKIKEIVFKVQFMNSYKKIPLTSATFSDANNVFEYDENGAYKYYSGSFKTIDDAIKEQNRMRTKGFKDAFVTAFNNGKKISVKEAKELLNKH